jgi:hypothetical protein
LLQVAAVAVLELAVGPLVGVVLADWWLALQFYQHQLYIP